MINYAPWKSSTRHARCQARREVNLLDNKNDKTASQILVCDCQNSMDIDGAALAGMLGRERPLTVHRELCRGDIAAFERALQTGETVHVACTQEAPLFREIAEQSGGDDTRLSFTNIRETAGWCEARGAALPKMAALLAEAAHEPAPAGLVTLQSNGLCLVYGAGQAALDAARALGERLDVTVLLTDAGDAVPPSVITQPLAKGRIRTIKGHLGAFDIEIDGFAAVEPSSRDVLKFAGGRDGTRTRADLVLDLSGGTPFFAEPHPRDGYLHADPANPAAVARALFTLSDLVGEFEKPRYVSYDPTICVHARSRKVGCSNCLDACPVGAIVPIEDNVAIDAAICGGCGSCAAHCPTGAVSYVFPQRKDVYARARLLIETYRKAGGQRPVLLLHDEKHGREMIDAIARFGRGLPANVLPMSLNSVHLAGHDQLAALLALGLERIVLLVPPKTAHELAPLEAEVTLMATVLRGLGYQGERVDIVVERDPDALEGLLHGLPSLAPIPPHAASGIGSKRDMARTALAALHGSASAPQPRLPLTKGAPYGQISIDTSGCTLCLACVGACPTGALADNAERPEVRFTEAACVQCGICAATCPEKVISLEPRYDFTTDAMTPRVLHHEPPFHCIRCGTPFGAKSSVERVVQRLAGHSMFQTADKLALIQMCETCRIVAMSEATDNPMRGPDRPRVRTTDDYLAGDAARKSRSKPDDFIG